MNKKITYVYVSGIESLIPVVVVSRGGKGVHSYSTSPSRALFFAALAKLMLVEVVVE